MIHFLVLSILAATPMLRVVEVKDARTLVVDDRGVAAEVTLAQVAIAPGDAPAAVDWLRRTLVSSYVMIERDASGAYVYRSPDALFVNGELARRAFLSPTTRMTYLGESDPARGRAPAPRPQHAPAPRRVLPPSRPHHRPHLVRR